MNLTGFKSSASSDGSLKLPYWTKGETNAFFGLGFNILVDLEQLVRFGLNDVWWHNLRWFIGDFVAVGVAVPLIIFRAYWLHAVGLAFALVSLLFFLASIQL